MILLDTHILVWAELEHTKLSRAAKSALARARVSGGIAGLIYRGRIRLPGTIESQMALLTSDLILKPITHDIALWTVHLPPEFPMDPADRIIAATARAENLPLITADQRMLDCPLLKTIW